MPQNNTKYNSSSTLHHWLFFH